MKGISEIIATILMLMITLALAGSAYVFIFGAFNQKTRGLSLVDTFCNAPAATVVVRNDGQDTIRSSEQTLITVSSACTKPTLVDISAGNNTVYTFTDCIAATTNTFRLIGPANSVPITFRCS